MTLPLLATLATLLLVSPPPGAESASALAPPGEQAPLTPQEATWSVCRLEVTVLLNSGKGSRVVARDTGLLFQGESFDLEHEIELGEGERQALVRLRARIRATVARENGVIYRVTTEATLASSIGFISGDTGSETVRDALVPIEDASPQFIDAYSSSELGSRVLLAITARPLAPEEAVPGDLVLGADDVREFRIEALLTEPKSFRVISQAVLSAMPGRPASFAFGSLASEARIPEDAAKRLGAGVTVHDLGYLPDSGYGEGRTQQPHDVDENVDYIAKHRVAWDDDFANDNIVILGDEDDPKTQVVRRTSPKMSNAKKRKLRGLQEAEAAKRMAYARQTTLPSGEALPEGIAREDLRLELRPLHASRDHVQVEVKLMGHMRLPGEKELTEIHTSFLHQFEVGEPLDIGLAALVHGGEPEYDYVLRITPLL